MATSNTATHPRLWQLNLRVWLLILVVPALVASQWLALTVAPAARAVFNVGLLAASVALLFTPATSGRQNRRLLVGAGVVVLAVVISILVNQVFDLRIALFGSFPYVVPVLAGLAALAWRNKGEPSHVAISVFTVTVGILAIAAVLQLALGETGFRITGQVLDYPRWWERGRATGLVMNPGRLAHIGLLALIVAPIAGKWRFPLVIGGAVAAAASGGRTVVVAIALLALLALGLRNWEGRRTVALGLAATAVLFGLFQLTVPHAADDFWGRVDTTADGEQVDVRRENLEASWRLLQAKPLLGAGPGRFGSTTAFATESELHDEYGLLDVRSPEFVEQLRESGDDREIDIGTAQLDIGLVQIATELGILGLAATLGFAWLLLRRAFAARSLAGLGLLVLLGLFSVTGPGWADASLAGAILWWAGALIGASEDDDIG